MDTVDRPHSRIAFVLTRDPTQRNGRAPIVSHIIRTMDLHHTVKVLRLRSLLEARDLWGIAGALLCWLKSVLRGRPLPLQCVLYASPSECARLTEQIRQLGCDAVYLDTVRCQTLLRALRRTLPRLHVVTDFDDLMSRRAAHLLRNRMPLLAGHVGPHFPRWLRFLAEVLLARFITAYEAATLPAAEAEVLAASDATVLLSHVERDMLLGRLTSNAAETPVYAIPPAFAVQAAPWRSAPMLRFIFIGSDNQLQNRSAIDCLVTIWRTLQPVAQLHVYGRQNRPTAEVTGIYWHGHVEDLSQVYQAGSIALVPAQVAGGVKTKVAEAWAWGCPALCDALSLEGLAIEGYPLMFPVEEWSTFLTRPSAHLETWRRAAEIGNAFVRASLSPAKFEHAWETTLRPASRALPDLATLSQIEHALR